MTNKTELRLLVTPITGTAYVGRVKIQDNGIAVSSGKRYDVTSDVYAAIVHISQLQKVKGVINLTVAGEPKERIEVSDAQEDSRALLKAQVQGLRAAMEFSLSADDGFEWLQLWYMGDFDVCRREWPESPEECFIGADIGHPKTRELMGME